MSLPENLGRLSSALTSDASLNIGVGVTPSGSFKLEVGTTSKFTGVATFGSTLSNGTYTYTLPSATGTLALTSAIPANPVGGTGTTNYLPKFTATSTIGDSLFYDNGTLTAVGNRVSTNSFVGLVRNFNVLGTDAAVRVARYTDSYATLHPTVEMLNYSDDGVYRRFYWDNFVNGSDSYGIRQRLTGGGPTTNGTVIDQTRLTIFSGGNVGINTTTDAGYKLDVNGTVNLSGALSGTSATFSGTSGVTLTTNGVSGQWSTRINGNSTAGSSYGLGVYAGINSSDDSFRVHSYSGTQYFAVRGDGLATFSGTNANIQLGATAAIATSDNLRHIFAGIGAFIGQDTNGEANIGNNIYYSTGFKRRVTGFASNVRFNDGNIYLQVAASGAADSAITWTNALTIASTGEATFSSSVTATKFITTNTSGAILDPTSSGVNSSYLYAQNTGGIFYFGKETSTGSAFSATAYASVLYSSGAYPMEFFTDATKRLTIASTGAATFSSANQALGGAFNTVGNLLISSTDSFAINTGGSLSLGGKYNSAGTPIATFARIHGKKENATVDDTSGYLAFETVPGATANLTERMRITSGGYVLVGTTTSNSYPFEVAADAGGNLLYLKRSLAFSDIFMGGTTAAATQLFVRSGGSVGVRLDTGAGSWTSASDERLKNISGNIENATKKLNTLRAVNFTWKSDKENTNNLGLIAQDVIKVFPELVSESSQDGMYGVRYQDLIPVLVKAIQEQQAQIEELKALIK